MDNREARDALAELADTIEEKLGRLRYVSQQLVVHPDDWMFALGELAALSKAADLATDLAASSARESGRSWSQIGSVLEVSKQAAQQRFGT